MRSMAWRLYPIAGAVAALLSFSPTFAADTAGPGDRVETIVPEPTDLIDLYEGSLDPNNGLTGGLVDPSDEFDWWCLNVQAGVPLVIELSGSTGARPNCGLVQDIAADGDAFQELGQILGATNNGTSENAILTVTPDFSGPATVWISNAGSGFNVSYTVEMSGGTVNQSCNPCPDCPPNPAVDYNNKVRFIVGQQRNVPGGFIDVPLLVDTGEAVTFTQMTVTIGTSCLAFVSAVNGSGVMNPGSLLSFVQAGMTTTNVTVQAPGEYGPGCRVEVFVLRFSLVGGGTPPCPLVLDRTTGIANPPNHVIADTNTDGTGDTQLVGDANGFCDGVIDVADLALTKTVNVANPAEGQQVVFTIGLTNNGPSQASGIVVTDLLPAGLTFVSATPSQGTYTSATGVWSVGSLANAGVATLGLTATVNTGTAGQTIANIASVTAVDQADPTTSNNSATRSVIVQSADLGVTKTVDIASPNVGQQIVYTITVTNGGPNPATNVGLFDQLPPGLTYVSHTASQGSYTPGTGVWDVGSIPHTASRTLTLRATVNTGTGGTTITNTASTTNVVPPDPVPGNNTGSVPITVQAADLGVTKTVDIATPNVGQQIAFLITVANAGPNAATTVRITDLLPAGLTYVSHTASQGTYVPGTGLWTIGTINSMISVTLTLRATVNTGTGGTTITNNANNLLADQADPNSGNNTASRGVTVQAADLGVTKTVDVPSPNVGQLVVYTITVSNPTGPNIATNVRLTDLLPMGVTYVSHTASQGTYVPGTGLWTIGTINVMGSPPTLTLRATVNTGTGGTMITNTANGLLADQADPGTGNNSASAVITVQAANLGVTKTVDIASPNVGQQIVYTVTVTNGGGSNATNVRLTDLLPAGLTYVSHTASQGTYVPGTGLWTIGTLNNMASVTLTLRATVNAGTGCTMITNIANTLLADQADPDTGNNSASRPITVQCANLGVTKTVDIASPNVGQQVVFLITVTNGGANHATNVRLTDALPAGLTYVSHTASQGTYVSGTGLWTIGTINNGANATLTLRATVATGTGCTTITNTAGTLLADQEDPVPNNNFANRNIDVQCANLGVTKTVDVPSPNIGQQIAFLITVANGGANNATNVRITDLLPAGLTYVSHTASQGAYVQGTGLWTIGTINNMANATLTLRATVNAGTGNQMITNTANMLLADQADPNPGNNSASATIHVQSADIGLSKTVDDASPVIGQLVVYTITATNGGPTGATNVVVTDLLPAGITYVSHAVTQGMYTPGTGVWAVGALANPGSATLTLRGTVNTGTAGMTITNQATVTGADQSDPVPGNNTASIPLTVDCADVDVAGTVRYYSNARPILPSMPDATAVAVTVRDCTNGAITDPATDGTYELSYGDGPFSQICICATRPSADCNGNEGAVISGQDLILIEDIIAMTAMATPRQLVAADLNKDGLVLSNDRNGIAQWIAHANPCMGNTCLGQPTDNCAGTWRFLYKTGDGPSDFVLDQRCMNNVCVDQTVPIEGLLLGDVDGSWPNLFPTAVAGHAAATPSAVQLTFESLGWEGDVVTMALATRLDGGQALHHVIYSLDYDATQFEYLGAQPSGLADDWGWLDNPAQAGVAHGVVHRKGGKPPITRSGEVVRFRFRARTALAEPRFTFSRLKANDLDVEMADGRPVSRAPERYALTSTPNPFNPSTRIRFAIPDNAGDVRVSLRVYDIGGRVVRTLVQDTRGPGFHEVDWNGTDDRGNGVGTGIYFLQIRAGTWSDTRKLVLLK